MCIRDRFRYHSCPFRFTPQSFRLVPVHSDTILVHSVSFRRHSASFRYIPVYSVPFNSVPVFSNAPTIYSPYLRRLESLTMCRCNCKGSTFSSVILRPWAMAQPESNSRPPAWQPDAQPTEPPVQDQFDLKHTAFQTHALTRNSKVIDSKAWYYFLTYASLTWKYTVNKEGLTLITL